MQHTQHPKEEKSLEKTGSNTVPTSRHVVSVSNGSGEQITTGYMRPANRKIKFASMQAAIQAPGIFPSEVTLSTTKQKGIDMELEPGVLVVKWEGQTVLVPLTNIKSMVVA